MQVILFTILGALILIWAAIFALLKWVQPFEKKHLLGFGGYVSVVSGALIFLVIQTSMRQQAEAFKETRDRLDKTVDLFRQKLDEQSGKLFDRAAEKAELTKSEWEVRGDLQTERSQHARTRRELEDGRKQLRDTQAELIREAAAHSAYVDSLNTERGLHRDARLRLEQEMQAHQATRQGLENTREALAKAQERLAAQKDDLERLRGSLTQAEQQVQAALKNTSVSQEQLQKKLVVQQGTIETLQAAVDSIYRKVLKKPRVPGSEPPD